MQSSIVKKVFVFILFAVLFTLASDLYAQCPMCRSAVESAMQQEGNTVGRGLNRGILYLLATPYLMILVVGGIWYRNNRKNRG